MGKGPIPKEGSTRFLIQPEKHTVLVLRIGIVLQRLLVPRPYTIDRAAVQLESPAPPSRPNWTQRSRLLPSVSSVGHRSPGTSLRNRNTIVSPRTPCTESRGTIGLRSVSPSTNRSPSSSRTNCSSRLVCVSVRLYRFTSGACTCSTTKYLSWSHTVDGKR
uniref:Uncharacterized protein n=1 Tax=Anopheles melas TaxID=34690 RepID=A0A182UEA7_9DIPT